MTDQAATAPEHESDAARPPETGDAAPGDGVPETARETAPDTAPEIAPEIAPTPGIWARGGKPAERVEDAEVMDTDAEAARAAGSEGNPEGDKAADAGQQAPADEPPGAAAAPAPAAPAPVFVRRGGLVPTVLGGVIAAGIGYGAAYLGYLPVPGDSGDAARVAGIEADLQGRTAELDALRAQVADLAEAAAMPAPGGEAPAADLGPVLVRIDGLAGRIDETVAGLDALTARIASLEERPVLSGDPDADTTAALETAAQLEAELTAEREAAAARAADLEAIRAEAEAATAAAEEAAAAAAATIAEAEAEAAAAVARAAAEAALGQVQVALEAGGPFAEPLADLSAMADAPAIPDPLAAVADSGVATLPDLQEAFPPLARAALPVALQETAGESVGDRVSAFVRGQVGGRSVEPREGSDPDAVLSRIEAAVRADDLPTVLSEAALLPSGARDVLAAWLADVEARAGAEAGLDALTAALSGTGN